MKYLASDFWHCLIDCVCETAEPITITKRGRGGPAVPAGDDDDGCGTLRGTVVGGTLQPAVDERSRR
jgi:hypothetical protein